MLAQSSRAPIAPRELKANPTLTQSQLSGLTRVSHLRDVRKLCLTPRDLLWCHHYVRVDDQDVGELGGKAQLDSDPAVKLEVSAFWEDWEQKGAMLKEGVTSATYWTKNYSQAFMARSY